MTDQLTYPRIILPEDEKEIDDLDDAIESKEWFEAEVELENGDRYTLNFLTPFRVKQDLDRHIERGEEPWIAKYNIILVPQVTLKAAQECVQALWHKGRSHLKTQKLSRKRTVSEMKSLSS